MNVNPITLAKLNNVIVRNSKNCVSAPTVLPSTVALMSTATASAIAAATLVKPHQNISAQDIEKKLVECGFKKEFETLEMQYLPNEYSDSIREKYGLYAENIIKNRFNKKFSREEIQRFSNFINTNAELGKKMFNNNFDKLLDVYITLSKHPNFHTTKELFSKDKNLLKMIDNLVSEDLSPEFMDCVYKWKGKANKGVAYNAQQQLRHRSEKKLESTERFIKHLSEGLETQILPENLTLYRREGKESLKNVVLKNGETINLAKIMTDISGMERPETRVDELREFVMDNEISAIQPGFMSTTIDKNLMKWFKGVPGPDMAEPNVIWELRTTANTKGAFLEGLNADAFACEELEVLLQKNSKITIEDIQYNKYHDKWYINARVSN